MSGVSNVLVAIFEEESKTYQAFSEVKQIAARNRDIKIQALAVVRRAADGRMETPEVFGRGYAGSLAGGLIGSLIGLAGGPLGILLGWGAGAIVGGIRDFGKVRSNVSLLEQVSANMSPGSTALIGELEETSRDPVNTVVLRLGGEILRRPASEIEVEIERAQRAESSAVNEARRVFGDRNSPDTNDADDKPSDRSN